MAVSTLETDSLSREDQVIYDPEKNTKQVITYESDDDGLVYKLTKNYRIERVRVSSAVAKRRAWKKFGDSADDPPGPNPANTYPGEVVETKSKAKEEEVQQVKPKQTVTCRTCKGGHFSHQCPYRDEMKALQSFMDSTSGADGPDEKTRVAAQEVASDLNTGRYIPGRVRDMAVAMNGAMPERRRLEGYSIRVTNLPENTNEADLRDIFQRFGTVIRIFPAKDKRTQLNRGFAYISYATQDEAAAAIYSANGMRYDHLILKADWAQPSNT